MLKGGQDSLSKFTRTSRLKTKQEFQFVFAKPGKVAHKYLLALYRPNERSHARLGIIVGKHHIKTAVARNQLRRVIRESFRHHQEALKGLDIIVLVRSECTSLLRSLQGKKILRDDIGNLWQALIKCSRLS
ncbi:ribonuclease P protein component [Aquicella lusitana]|uniref:Ribonuclease P protein component n=1 Tax=Aquicella lusitana TaxID=254246 RepID=A0A370GSA6_9COXI|nr:ribonuclease P protein component [Aquicella lusitana]RDI46582.1 ribonuclease P protein component [Aquicella lusitana]VVC74246.1 Ribonuclease P protein component [Aquicella lusitana]